MLVFLCLVFHNMITLLVQTSPDTARLPRHRGGTGAPPHAHDARDPPATDTRRERRWTVDAVPVGHKRLCQTFVLILGPFTHGGIP